MEMNFNEQCLKKLRLKIKNNPGNLGNVCLIIGTFGFNVGEIEIKHIGPDYKIRDINVYYPCGTSFDELIKTLNKIVGVKVIGVINDVMNIHTGGKIEISSKVKMESLSDVRKIYTPGVASVCMEIFREREKYREYTSIPNNVAIVTDGTAILGLGDIGPVAGMPVMEGKSVLFKELVGINGIPVLLGTKNVDEIINTVKNIAPSFGAIKLEDIKAPECFEIEEKLDELLDIPVVHDDQQGTAVVVLAALLNVEKYTGVKLKDSRIGVIGLGAAGNGISKLLFNYGVEKIFGTDINNEAVLRFEKFGGKGVTLEELMKKSDIVIATTGKPGLIKEDMVRRGQIILALSNPNPEIEPEVARESGAIFAADGKAVNNALAFPGLFRGALDSFATTVNVEMKIEAAREISRNTPEGDLVPNILDREVHKRVAEAVFKAAIKSGVARV